MRNCFLKFLIFVACISQIFFFFCRILLIFWWSWLFRRLSFGLFRWDILPISGFFPRLWVGISCSVHAKHYLKSFLNLRILQVDLHHLRICLNHLQLLHKCRVFHVVSSFRILHQFQKHIFLKCVSSIIFFFLSSFKTFLHLDVIRI
jgi:hypothetical protein